MLVLLRYEKIAEVCSQSSFIFLLALYSLKRSNLRKIIIWLSTDEPSGCLKIMPISTIGW